MELEICDNRLLVDEVGPRDAPALIALHGGPGVSDHRDARVEYEAYADTFRVIVFDARGSGLSEGNSPLTHEQWVADVEGIRDHFDIDRFVMAGGSYGGFIAMEYAIRHPKRLLALILRDTAADFSDPAEAIRSALNSSHADVSREMLLRVMEGRCHSDEDLRACFEAMAPLYSHSKPSPKKPRRTDRVFRHETHNFAFSHNLPSFDVKPQLPDLDVPTLVMCGRHDWIAPVSESAKIHNLIPNSEFVIFEESGHSPVLEEAAKVHAIVRDFLEKSLSSAGIK